MTLSLEEIITRIDQGENLTVPPALMPDYIRYQYTLHPCVYDFLKVRLREVRQGEIFLELELRPEFTNSWDSLYGGIMAAMADAMSLGLIVSVGKLAVTVNLAMNFLKAHPAKGTLTLHGTLRHRGKRFLALRGEITSDEGELLADIQSAMLVVGTLAEVPKTW